MGVPSEESRYICCNCQRVKKWLSCRGVDSGWKGWLWGRDIEEDGEGNGKEKEGEMEGKKRFKRGELAGGRLDEKEEKTGEDGEDGGLEDEEDGGED